MKLTLKSAQRGRAILAGGLPIAAAGLLAASAAESGAGWLFVAGLFCFILAIVPSRKV